MRWKQATAPALTPGEAKRSIPFPDMLSLIVSTAERAPMVGAWETLSLTQQLAITRGGLSQARYALAMLRGMAISANTLQEAASPRRAIVPAVCNVFRSLNGFRTRYVALSAGPGRRSWCRVRVYGVRSRMGRIVRPGHINDGDRIRFSVQQLPCGAEIATIAPDALKLPKFRGFLRLVK